MAGAAAGKPEYIRPPRHVRAGYVRLQAFVPRVLWQAMKVEAARQHRTPSAEVICALEAWLGWDGE